MVCEYYGSWMQTDKVHMVLIDRDEEVCWVGDICAVITVVS